MPRRSINQSIKALTRMSVILSMIVIILFASISTYLLTATLQSGPKQTDSKSLNIDVQSCTALSVHNPQNHAIHLLQNGSIYVNNIIRNILTCDGSIALEGQLIALNANQTVELTIDYQASTDEELNIKVISVDGADLATYTQITNNFTINRRISYPAQWMYPQPTEGQSKIVFTSGDSQSVYANLLSSPIVIQRQDSQNAPITTGTITITLNTSLSGAFYSDSSGNHQVSSVTIANGSNLVIVWYRSASLGMQTITASSTGYSSASTTFNIKDLSGLSVWDQTGDTSTWVLSKLGGGNSGTLSVASPGYNDSYAAQLICTAYPTTNGTVAMTYWFDTLSIGQTYTCTFYYKSDVSFMAYFFAADEEWNSVYNTSIECESSSSWKLASFEIGPIQSATFYWLSFNLYSIGELQMDNVSFGDAI